MTWAKLQPRDGDVVLSCGHDVEHWHFFKAGYRKERVLGKEYTVSDLRFRRPDGTDGYADWLVCCDACLERAGGDPMRLEIRTDAIWRGNAPVIKEPNRS